MQLERQTPVALQSVTSGPVDDGLCKTLCPAGNLLDKHAPLCNGAGRKEQQVLASHLVVVVRIGITLSALLSVLLGPQRLGHRSVRAGPASRLNF